MYTSKFPDAISQVYFVGECFLSQSSSCAILSSARAPAVTALAKSSSFSRSRISSAMAFCVRRSSLSSFGATSRFKSQSGFRGARLTKSNSLITKPWCSFETSSLTCSDTSPG